MLKLELINTFKKYININKKFNDEIITILKKLILTVVMCTEFCFGCVFF